jgi:hypothetical protein
MGCRKLLPESKMHKLMRFHEITPGLNLNQIQIEFRYYVTNNIGKRFMGYMCDNCLGLSIKRTIALALR